MSRICLGLLLFTAVTAGAANDVDPLIHRHWFEARTEHFNIYTCGETQQVSRLAGRLEQFRQAYSVLAGAQAVASPPIVVMAFPDMETMRPFRPVREGQPANLTAFFHQGGDENLIVLPLTDAIALQAMLHEYTHLLLRHNDAFWPLWLKEGMAEIYGTLTIRGAHVVSIGRVIPEHVQFLSRQPVLPLSQLFAVNHESAEYNESKHQGIFYAQSWLLTHFLMLGDSAAHRPGFGQMTRLLRQGQVPEAAFTNAFHLPLTAIEQQFRHYLERGKFDSMELSVAADLLAPRPFKIRPLNEVEVCFRLGDELLRIDRLDTAEMYFLKAQELDPHSPLPAEGLGLLAVKRHEPEQAVRLLGQALERGTTSFLAHYLYAAQKYRIASGSSDHFQTVSAEVAKVIREELQKSLAIMPDFAGAHHLLGVLELVQEADLKSAEKHLQRAIQLEPENLAYLFSLGQAQWLKGDRPAARRTLGELRKSFVEPELRLQVEELLKEMEHGSSHVPR